MTETLATALQAVEIFAARHPRPSHVSQKQAAEMLELSVSTIRKMIAKSYSRMVPATGIELSMLARIVVKRVY